MTIRRLLAVGVALPIAVASQMGTAIATAAPTAPDETSIPPCADVAAMDPVTGAPSAGTYHTVNTYQYPNLPPGPLNPVTSSTPTLDFTYYLWQPVQGAGCTNVSYTFNVLRADAAGNPGSPMVAVVNSPAAATSTSQNSWQEHITLCNRSDCTAQTTTTPQNICVWVTIAQPSAKKNRGPVTLETAPDPAPGQSTGCYALTLDTTPGSQMW